MKVGIGYAAYISNDTHFAFARETLNSIVSAEHELKFCGVVNLATKDDYVRYLESKGTILHNPENNVSMGWNRAINQLLSKEGCDYVIVPNLDVVFKSNLVDNMVRMAEAHKEFILWTALPWNDLISIEQAVEVEGFPETPHFSVFMVDKRLFKKVGEFDINFRPAYNEDLDMHWRIVIAGEKAIGYEGARFFHHISRTIHSDPNLLQLNHTTHSRNDQYFIQKWGDKPGTAADPFLTEKMFKVPFNKS